MPPSEKKEGKIACQCNACELTLADGKATFCLVCTCEDCRQALQWGFKNGGVKPDPLPRVYYMRSDIIDVKGRDKMVVVKLREDGASRRIYCTNCYSILGVDHPNYKDNAFANWPEHCKNSGDLTAPSRIPSFIRPVQKRRRRAVAPAAFGRSAASAGPASHHACSAVDRRASSPDGTTNERDV